MALAVSMQHPGARMAKPPHPYLVLAAAILLPGFGHVLLGRTQRGLILQLFMISLGFITWQLTTPAQSLVGRLAGGLFVYALSIPDAYRTAKLRWVLFQQSQPIRLQPDPAILDTNGQIPHNDRM